MSRLTPKTQDFSSGQKIFIFPDGRYEISEAIELPENAILGTEIPGEEGVYFLHTQFGAYVIRTAEGQEPSVGIIYFHNSQAYPDRLSLISNVTGDVEETYDSLDDLDPITALSMHPDGFIYASRRSSVPRMSLYLFNHEAVQQWEWHDAGSTQSGQNCKLFIDDNGDIYYSILVDALTVKVARIDDTGNEVWVREYTGLVSAPSTYYYGATCAKHGNTLWVAARRTIHIIDATTGDEIDSIATPTLAASAALTQDGTFWVGLGWGDLTPYTQDNGTIIEGDYVIIGDNHDITCVSSYGEYMYVSGTDWTTDMGVYTTRVSLSGDILWEDTIDVYLYGSYNTFITPSGEIFSTFETYGEEFPIIVAYTPDGERLPGFEPVELDYFTGNMDYLEF